MFRSNVCSSRFVLLKLVFAHSDVIGVIQTERFDYAQIFRITDYVIGWYLCFMLFEHHPFCAFKERVRF